MKTCSLAMDLYASLVAMAVLAEGTIGPIWLEAMIWMYFIIGAVAGLTIGIAMGILIGCKCCKTPMKDKND